MARRRRPTGESIDVTTSMTGSFLWKVDTDERIFSEELQRIFEFEPNVVVTAEILAERVHPDDLPLLAEKITQVQSGGDNPEYEIRLRMRDGRIKFVRVFGRTIPREDGRVECIGAVQDVTLRRRAEEARDKVRSELAHVSRVVSLGALTASIAHEVNQPLASIITNGETGLRWLARPEPVRTRHWALKRHRREEPALPKRHPTFCDGGRPGLVQRGHLDISSGPNLI
jgi:PAS domain S-box-containing protein